MLTPISFQMVPYVTTAEDGYQSYTTNKSRRRRSFRRGLRDYGPSASGAKDPFIRSVPTSMAHFRIDIDPEVLSGIRMCYARARIVQSST